MSATVNRDKTNASVFDRLYTCTYVRRQDVMVNGGRTRK